MRNAPAVDTVVRDIRDVEAGIDTTYRVLREGADRDGDVLVMTASDDHEHINLGLLRPLNTPIVPRMDYGLVGRSCACPECGWDDDGELRIVDWYEECFPPIPAPRYTLAVWGDGEEQHHAAGVTLCPLCDSELSPHSVTLVDRPTKSEEGSHAG